MCLSQFGRLLNFKAQAATERQVTTKQQTANWPGRLAVCFVSEESADFSVAARISKTSGQQQENAHRTRVLRPGRDYASAGTGRAGKANRTSSSVKINMTLAMWKLAIRP